MNTIELFLCLIFIQICFRNWSKGVIAKSNSHLFLISSGVRVRQSGGDRHGCRDIRGHCRGCQGREGERERDFPFSCQTEAHQASQAYVPRAGFESGISYVDRGVRQGFL